MIRLMSHHHRKKYTSTRKHTEWLQTSPRLSLAPSETSAGLSVGIAGPDNPTEQGEGRGLCVRPLFQRGRQRKRGVRAGHC